MKPVPSAGREREADAFTMTELVVVLGCLALLALTVVPALAGGRDKSSRIQCANNLRQLHAGSMQFANDNSGKLPWGRAGSNPVNFLRSAFYSRYVWYGPTNSPVPQSLEQTNGSFQNAGWLYGSGFIGHGKALFCPGYSGVPNIGEEQYRPLLNSGPTGIVRSDYNYNPRVRDPRGDFFRQFQEVSDLEPQKLFAVDLISEGGMDRYRIAHFGERGWNVLFTDGAVQFSTDGKAWESVVVWGIPLYDSVSLHAVFDLLEQPR